MKFAYIALLLAVLPLSAADAFDHSHETWNGLLKTYAKKGRVNYQQLIAKDLAKLTKYLNLLAGVTETEIKNWSRQEKLAYWINAYNACTFKAITDNYPIKARGMARLRFPTNSIRQIPGVWDKLKFKAGGQNLTLNQIEHEKLRAQLKEPRIHFALVCASVGCPDLRNEAYTADRIEEQLEDGAKRFVRDPTKVRIDRKAGKLYLSQILKWFGNDFKDYKAVAGYGKQQGIVSFVTQYSQPTSTDAIKATKLKVAWLDYDWTLNSQ